MLEGSKDFEFPGFLASQPEAFCYRYISTMNYQL